MDTRKKLKEAKYFLDALKETEAEWEQFLYNLSAFLSAWKSVLDVMLYDFAKHFSIGLSSQNKITSYEFGIAAKAQNNSQALNSLKWWNTQLNFLNKNPLWKMRNIIIHRGYPDISYRVYTPDSTSSGTAVTYIIEEFAGLPDVFPEGETPIRIPGTPVEFKFSNILGKCKEAFDKMKSIVREAEEEFKIKL